MERTREVITGPLTIDYFMRKAAEGWTLAAVEWVRPAAEAASPELPSPGVTAAIAESIFPGEAVPYGLRLTDGGARLEPNPLEQTVLLLILDKIVKEQRITQIARELNQQGLTTRSGAPWGPTDVFDLLPRLIEAGPSLLRSPAWLEMRPASPSTRPV